MPLQLTISDTETGLTYENSVHVVFGANTNMKEKRCLLLIEIYANATTMAAGKRPIVFNGNNRPFHTIEMSGADFDTYIAAIPTAEEAALSLSPRAFFRMRAEAYLKTLTEPFNYAAATII